MSFRRQPACRDHARSGGREGSAREAVSGGREKAGLSGPAFNDVPDPGGDRDQSFSTILSARPYAIASGAFR